MSKKMKVIKAKKPGQSDIHYHPGGLHESTHTPAGQKIPASKREEAREGKLGPKAKKQELTAENVFHR
jgi:hypothetical protein